jgi:trigger factor
MNKENKKRAQEQRALERQKKAQQEKTKRTLKIFIPTVIILALLVWIIADSLSQSGSDSAAGDTEEVATESTYTDTETTASDEADADTDADADSDESDDSSAESTLYTGTDVAIQDGDTVNIDYVGYVDGEAFSGGDTQGAGTDLTIGSGMYIDNFEEQLIGHYVGETVEVVVTFPDDYSVEDLKGKEATFETVINGIYQ